MIKALYIKTQKGAPAEPRESLILLENLGAEGDVFAGGERQISIFYEESRKEAEKLGEKPCLKKFSCNILISGQMPKNLKTGSLLRIGGCELLITQIGRKCHELCAERDCPLIDGAVFARVANGGKINIGNGVIYA